MKRAHWGSWRTTAAGEEREGVVQDLIYQDEVFEYRH